MLTLPVDQEIQQLINRLSDQLDAKRKRGLLRETYYNQKRVLRQITTIVPPQYYRLGLVLGWAAKPVDLLANRCNLDGMRPTGSNVIDQTVKTVWDDNQLDIELTSAFTSTLVQGVTFLVNVAEDTGRVHAYDGLHATGDWNPKTRRMDNLLYVAARDNGEPSEIALYLPDRTVELANRGGWEVVSDEPNPWGQLLVEPMVFTPRISRPMGHSRISRATMALSDAAIRALVRMEGHLDIYSYPEYWVLGADLSIFENDDGSRQNVLQARMDRLKGLPDDDEAVNPRVSVQQFAASDPTPHLAGLNAYAKLLARETQLPDTAFALTDMANPTSAESYDASQYELIAMADRTTKLWSRPIRLAMQRAVAIANGDKTISDELKGLDTNWRSTRFLSRAAEADAGLKQLQAMPWLAETTVGLKLLGMSDPDIQQALTEKRRADGRQLLSDLNVAETTELPEG